MILLLGALLYRLDVQQVVRIGPGALAMAAACLASLPNVIVYAGRPSRFMLSGWGALVVLGVGLVAAIAIGLRGRRSGLVVATIVASGAIVAGANLASAASITTAPDVTRSANGSFTTRRHDMNASLAFVRYLQNSGAQDAPLAFWVQDGVGSIHAMLSTYLYMWPAAGRNLPTVDAELRQRLVYLHPYHLVLLCPGSCAPAVNALRRAGYRTQLGSSVTINSGTERVHVQIVNLPVNRVRGPYDGYARFYAIGQTALSYAPPKGAVLAEWDMRRGSPKGWTGASVDAMNAAHGDSFDTGSVPWEYELASTPVDLGPGTYAAYLRGSVGFGGLDLGVLDSATSRSLGQSLYWFRQVGFASGVMAVRFHLSGRTPVQLLLSNWIPSKQSSRWTLRDLRIVRLRS
jgi:hypothetical protein